MKSQTGARSEVRPSAAATVAVFCKNLIIVTVRLSFSRPLPGPALESSPGRRFGRCLSRYRTDLELRARRRGRNSLLLSLLQRAACVRLKDVLQGRRADRDPEDGDARRMEGLRQASR